MATTLAQPVPVPDRPLALAIDRWIWVIQAGFLIVVTLTGFVPASVEKVGAIMAGERPSYPLVTHLHAVLMGSFLLFLLAQATLMATDRRALHMRLGRLAFLLVPVMVAVGFALTVVNYQAWWDFMQSAPPETREAIQRSFPGRNNIQLTVIRVGILFPICMAIALSARKSDTGLHKRMMVLATALPMGAAYNRIDWLPTTMPESPLSPTLYICLSVAPLFLWDVIRNRRVHRAYWIWLALFLPASAVVHAIWGTPWWHATVPWLMGVG